MTSHSPNQKTVDPRRIALAVLNTVEQRPQPLDPVLSELAGDTIGLSFRDRALVNAVVYGVLRWRGRLDWIIRQLSSTPFQKISIPVRNTLRMGLFQMTYLDRIPDSAAIHTSVELIKSGNAPWVSRFVNAVLRAYQRRGDTLEWPDPNKTPRLAVSVLKSHPEWLIKRWINRFGLAETEALCDAHNRVPNITLRTNTLKTDRLQLIQSLIAHAEKVDMESCIPEAVRIEGLRTPIGQMGAFLSDWFQVQDQAAQLVSHLLSPRPGERVVDACAGRGGKTGHLAQLMDNTGKIIALDLSPKKLAVLKKEMGRLGVTIAHPAVYDLAAGNTNHPIVIADRVLVDAPCSGLGVIRRHPEARWSEEKRNLKRFQDRQALLLDKASEWVKPGGVLVYAVCSLEPEEGTEVVRTFLKDHPEFEPDVNNDALPSFLLPLMEEPSTLFILPHRHGMDGFFAARLIRKK